MGGMIAYLEYLLAMGFAKSLLYHPSSPAYAAGEGLEVVIYHLDRRDYFRVRRRWKSQALTARHGLERRM